MGGKREARERTVRVEYGDIPMEQAVSRLAHEIAWKMYRYPQWKRKLAGAAEMERSGGKG